MKEERIGRCARHFNFEKQYFCKSCDEALCSECAKETEGHHCGHHIVILKAEYDDAKLRVDSELENVWAKQKLIVAARK